MNITFPEVFLHHIWKLKLFDFKNLKTIQGEALDLVQIGTHNHHAGPDFSNARIKIGSTLWAGSVEIHKKSSDWLAHQHEQDEAYRNTILHVVYEHDTEIRRSNGEIIPTLELKGRIEPQYIHRYWKLLTNNHWIPCAAQLPLMLDLTARMFTWMDRLVVERLERKTQEIDWCMKQTNSNWEETFYWFLARSFGVKQNSEPFEALAKSLPLLVLSKHKQNLQQLEALLLGQAGFLEENFEEIYPQALQKEYQYLRQKYSLVPLQASSWKFGRMRPANFPTIRLAQFAVLVQQSSHLFSKILETQDIRQLRAMLDVQLSGYWETHYQLGEASILRPKSLGKGTVDLILINTVAPFLFVYGQNKGLDDFKERALELLQSLPSEQNSILQDWSELGIKSSSAYDSQALIQLKKEYCDQKRCLDCAVGNWILQG